MKVLGSSLSALVFCEQLVAKSIAVEHITLGTGNLGGYFAGIEYRDTLVDLGMVLLEPRFDGDSECILNYSPENPAEINKYNPHVFDWLESHCGSLEEIEVRTRFDGNLYNDVVIADDLSFMDGFNSDERLRVIQEIQERISTHQHHPFQKLTDRYFSENSIDQVYSDLYGPTLSTYLCNHIKLLAGDKGLSVVSRMHRSIWMPLIYPENFLNYLEQRNSNIPRLPFYGISRGSFAGMVERISAGLSRAVNYRRSLVSLSEYRDIVRSGVDSESKDVVVFASDKELSDVRTEIETEQVAFVVGQTNYPKNFVVNNIDFDSHWYRFTAMNADSNICVVEVGLTDDHESDSALISRANRACFELGLDGLEDPMTIRSRIQMLNVSAYEEIERRRAEVNTRYMGRKNYFYINELSSSLNHQIALGLKALSLQIGDKYSG